MTPATRTLLIVVALLASTLALRWATLDTIALNPDESQYEATAAYLMDAGRSAFSLPHATAGTTALYESAAFLFGPYSMFEIRLLVLLSVFLLAWLVWHLVQAEAGIAGGLLAAGFFLAGNLFFEGHSANREWFALPGLWGGMALALHASRATREKAARYWLLAGVVTSTALWFKVQAAYPVLTVPIYLALFGQRVPDRWRALLRFAAGGLAGSALYLLGFLRVGALGDYLRSLVTDAGAYASPGGRAGIATWLERLVIDLPGPGLVAAALVLLGAVALLRRHGTTGLGPLVAIHAVLCMAAVAMGSRFFGHYYLFLVPAWAVGVGLVPARAHSALWPVIAAILLAFRLLEPLAFAAPWIGWLYLAGAVAIVVAAVRLRELWRTVTCGLLGLECLAYVLAAVTLPPPASLPHHPDGFRRLAPVIEQHAAPDEPIFVWGWLPEIYSVARRTPATSFVITQYVVQDVRDLPSETVIDPTYGPMLMQELAERPPALIVDASARSWTMLASGEPALYDLERYEGFELRRLLESEYERIGRWDGCVVYVRRVASR